MKMRQQWNKTGLVGKFTIIGIVFGILFGAYDRINQKPQISIHNTYYIEADEFKFETATEAAKYLYIP